MLSVREGSENDIPLIHNLAHSIWPVAYREILTEAQLRYMLEYIYSYASLQKQIEVSGHQFLIAEENLVPRGFAAFSFHHEPSVFKLHKLYVLNESQGKGVGNFLLQEVISRCMKHNATALILNVNRYNKARHFYEKEGFVITGEENVDLGHGVFMNDYIMRKILI